jgi:hypothetical protein
MPDSFLHEILRTRKELAAAVLRFNAPTAADFAPDALPETAQRLLREGVLTRLEGSRAGRVMVRAYLLRLSESGRAPLFLDFREERRRLALLPRETLSRLAGLCGACIYAPEASRCVRRDEVLSLRAAIGSDYDHILTRGRFQLAESRARFADFLPESPLPERMRAAGFAALRLCLSDWPPSLLRPAGPRLPEELRAGAGSTPPLPADALPVIWLGVKKLLIKEVAPQWQACFE